MPTNHAWQHILGYGPDVVPDQDNIPTISCPIADRPGASTVTIGTIWIESTYNPGDVATVIASVSDGAVWRLISPNTGSFLSNNAGYILESFSHDLATSTQLMTAGTLYLSRVIIDDLYAVHRLTVRTAAPAAATATNFYFSYYDSGGNLIYQSSDQSAAVNGAVGEIHDTPASNPQFMLGPAHIGPDWNLDYGYIGVYVGAAGTAPTICTRDYTPFNLNQWEGAPGKGGTLAIGAGLTAMPNPITLSSLVQTSTKLPWLAVSTS